MLPLVFILSASMLGIAVSAFLRHVRETANKRKHSSCPPYYDCHLVVGSKYANFMGMPVEMLGVAYYGLIFFTYIGLAAFPALNRPWLALLVMIVTTFALLFSLYLTMVQLITLKRICVWCIVSTLLCTVIFTSAMAVAGIGLVPLLAKYKLVMLVFHLLGFALGVGGATVTDMFFFKFLRDYHISKWEAKVMHQVSELIWLGLAILIVSGLGLYLPHAEALNQSSKFLVKMLVVTVILINGVFLNLYLSPKLVHINFGQKHKHRPGELHYLRRAAFASGAISLVSWYSAFILGTIKSTSWTFLQILFLYVSLLLVAIAGSQALERLYDIKARLKK